MYLSRWISIACLAFIAAIVLAACSGPGGAPESHDLNLEPTADIAADVAAGTAPLAVQFDAGGSADPDGRIVSYAWDFDGVQPYDFLSDGPQLTHAFTAPGLYSVRLLVLDDAGAESRVTLGINVNAVGNALPVASLLPADPSGTAPFVVGFDASGSSDADGSIVNYEWDFDGDGTFDGYGGYPTVSHTYADPGVFTVHLRVTDEAGAQASAASTVTVNVGGNIAPVATFTRTPTTGDAPLTVAFDASGSSDADGAIVRYDWDFDGDGSWDGYDSGAKVSHFYSRPGFFSARLRVTDDAGAQTYVRDGVDVQVAGNFSPVAGLSATLNGDVQFGVTLDASGSDDSDGLVVKYDWDFDGDGVWDGFSEIAHVDHTYPGPGLYNPTVRVTDNHGAQSIAEADVNLAAVANDQPVAGFAATPGSGDAPLSVAFDASASSDADGTIIRYDWDFDGDGTWDAYDSGPVVSHTYPAAGVFDARLRVTDNAGAQAIAASSVTVNAPGNASPTASFTATPDIGDAPLSVDFDASASSDANGTIVRFDWDFDGDGVWDAYDSGPVVSHTYPAAGVFDARLRVTDNAGAQAIAASSITVNVPANVSPTASFTAIPGVGFVPLLVSFDASASADSDGVIVKYEWDFDGDGTWDAYGSGPTANHTYYSSGTFNPVLRVTDDDGASATATNQVEVNQGG